MWKVYGQTTGHQKSWIEQKLMWAKKLKWLRGPNKIDNKCTCLIFPGIRISSSRFWSSYRYGTLCTWKPSTSLSSQKRKMFYFTEKTKLLNDENSLISDTAVNFIVFMQIIQTSSSRRTSGFQRFKSALSSSSWCRKHCFLVLS